MGARREYMPWKRLSIKSNKTHSAAGSCNCTDSELRLNFRTCEKNFLISQFFTGERTLLYEEANHECVRNDGKPFIGCSLAPK